MENLKLSDVKIKHSSNIIVSGPSFSGKTIFVRNLLKHYKTVFSGLENNQILKVIYCYGVYQPLYDVPISETVSIQYVQGLKTLKSVVESESQILVFDDLMNDVKNSKEMVDVFTKFSHHKNKTIILIVQNLFIQSNQMRTLSLNAHYFVLLRNRRDLSQLQKLALQIDPENYKQIVEAYKDATSQNYGYLIIDMRADTHDQARLKTNIFPNLDGTWSPILYMLKQNVF